MDSDSPWAAPDARPGPAGTPVLAIVGGDPTAAEIAAVVTVIAARARAGAALADGAAPATASRHGWSDRSRLLREPIGAGPGGWRASGAPR